jgi:hypothetical protein
MIELPNSARPSLFDPFFSARIKAHRFRAFSDIPIFIKRHCDLTSASETGLGDKLPSHGSQGQDISKLSCCSLPSNAGAELTPSPISPNSSTSVTPLPSFFGTGFPFSSDYSATVCLNSASTIAEMFHSLPLPKPRYRDGFFAPQPSGAGSNSQPNLPRTMPSFACCAMQSSYALLMLYYRARVSQPSDIANSRDWALKGPMPKLRHGLTLVIGAVRNYSIAFEALDGMRG